MFVVSCLGKAVLENDRCNVDEPKRPRLSCKTRWILTDVAEDANERCQYVFDSFRGFSPDFLPVVR